MKLKKKSDKKIESNKKRTKFNIKINWNQILWDKIENKIQLEKW